MREEIIAAVEREKLIAIVRGVAPEQCLRVAQALYAGGVRLMEVTYNASAPETARATADAIAAIREEYEGRLLVGAGTVITPALVELTAAAGGQFIISPDTNAAVIGRTRELGLVSMPGALTPTEIMTAHWAGADFVKLFPAAQLGPAYIKAIRAPISHVKLTAVGGVNEENIPAFLAAGVSGFGVGGNLANRKWIEAGDFDKLTETARKMVAVLRG